MDFKDRFKGRTTVIRKEGVIDTFGEVSNPVQKSLSNTMLRKSPQTTTNEYQTTNVPSSVRRSTHDYIDTKPDVPLYHPHSYTRSPDNQSLGKPPRIPEGSLYNTGNKQSYMMGTPFPGMDVAESQVVPSYARLEAMNRDIARQSVTNNSEFNPNNFYNQHTQFRGTGQMNTPKEVIMTPQVNSNTMTNQMHKKNFENLSQQHRHKRMADEAIRGFDSQNLSYRLSSNQYDNSNQAPQGYNSYYKPQVIGYREIHSNPLSRQHQYTEGDVEFRELPTGNLTHQTERGRYSGDANAFMSGGMEGLKMGGYSKTSYKPYSVKDYKEMVRASVQLGGLGPNLNTEEWQKEKEKRNKMLEFAHNLKISNAQKKSGTENNFKVQEKDNKSKVESMQKPAQVRRHSSPMQGLSARKSLSDKPKIYGGSHNDVEEYERKHMQYVNQMEKVKFAKVVG